MKQRTWVETILFLLLLSGCILIFQQVRHTSITIDQLRNDLVHTGDQRTRKGLDGFFDPVALSLALNRDRGSAGLFDGIDRMAFNRMFFPVLKNNASVSSILLGNEDGNEHMLLRLSPLLYRGRTTRVTSEGTEAILSEWEVHDDRLDTTRQWPSTEFHDPRKRPWFIGAITVQEDVMHWTEPYRLLTTGDQGITASMRWEDDNGLTHVLAYDVMLGDLELFLRGLYPSPNGRAFLITDKGRLLGMTGSVGSTDAAEDPGDPYDPARIVEHWQRGEKGSTPLTMELGGVSWNCMIVPYRLGDLALKIGIMVPDSDVLIEVRHSRRMLIAGGVLLIVFAIMLGRVHRLNERAARVMAEQNADLGRRTDGLEESLDYAKYLQEAVLPSTNVFRSWLSESFILHRPMEKVGGDIHWLDAAKDRLLFAVGDATGHGIPGALVGMVCTGALDRAAGVLGYTRPSDILEATRQFVSETFQHDSEEMSDGMECCLCALHFLPPDNGSSDPALAELVYCGGNRPVYLLRSGHTAVEVLRTDRHSVSAQGRAVPFVDRSVTLSAGDSIYLCTDGITDQFGGPRNKKLGNAGLQDMLLGIRHLPMAEQEGAIARAFDDWKGDHPQVDDMCIVGIRLNERDRLLHGR